MGGLGPDCEHVSIPIDSIQGLDKSGLSGEVTSRTASDHAASDKTSHQEEIKLEDPNGKVFNEEDLQSMTKERKNKRKRVML